MALQCSPEYHSTNILSKIHDDHFKYVTSEVSIMFSFDLARWPSFWHQVTQFKLDLEIIKMNILNNIYDDYFKKCDLRSVNRVFLWFCLVT